MPADPLFQKTPVSSTSAPVSGATSTIETCVDCGGLLDPGRYARCLGCVSALWIALEEGYGREWVARHRGRE